MVSLSISAQIKVKNTTGKAIIGSDRTDDDLNNVLSASIFGKGGDYRYGSKLAFGDFGRYDNYGWNVFIGEYGNPAFDSDQLWLHGKKGIYLTWNRGDNIIGYYNASAGNKFTFNCDVYSYSTKLTSDERFKTNITKIDSSLIKLKKLNGMSYHYNFPDDFNKSPNSLSVSNNNQSLSIDTIPVSDKEKRDKAYFESLETNINNAKDKKLGFIAQDLKKVFPELVEQDSAGYFYVDYVGLIPVIIEALKEQQAIIDSQSSKIKELEKKVESSDKKDSKSKSSGVSTDIIESDITTNAFLFQNTPNPFNYTTEIKYFIPNGYGKAALYIFNLQGNLIKSVSISDSGHGNVTINASELQPGMYLYSLLINGKQVDTKRMILTE
jgi:hypothetical protein